MTTLSAGSSIFYFIMHFFEVFLVTMNKWYIEYYFQYTWSNQYTQIADSHVSSLFVFFWLGEHISAECK